MYGIGNIIFDLDGTLVSLPVDWYAVYNRLRSEIKVPFNSLLELYEKLWNTKYYEKISRIIEEYELEAVKNFEILDDANRMISEFSKKYRLGLVTLQARNVAIKVLKNMGILEKFEIMITRNEAPTRLRQLEIVLQMTNFHPVETMVVGDKDSDAEAALKLGCYAVLVNRRRRTRWRSNPKQKIFVIDNLQEIPKIISNI